MQRQFYEVWASVKMLQKALLKMLYHGQVMVNNPTIVNRFINSQAISHATSAPLRLMQVNVVSVYNIWTVYLLTHFVYPG